MVPSMSQTPLRDRRVTRVTGSVPKKWVFGWFRRAGDILDTSAAHMFAAGAAEVVDPRVAKAVDPSVLSTAY
jgi:hypothetical protein